MNNETTFCIKSSSSIGLHQDRPIPVNPHSNISSTTRASHSHSPQTLERVSLNGSPSPLKTEAPRQTGPESRVPGRETPIPPASRRWVPPSLRPQHDLTPETQNDAVFRKVRGILNKLTPENFLKLGDELLKIDLNSNIILKGVIHLIFEKVVDEQKYSSMYAQLCKRLSVEAPNLEDNKSSFRILLLKVCRDRFLNRASLSTNNHDANDEEKLLIAKQRMLGNVKFIGELSKLDMLNVERLHSCISDLLQAANRSSSLKEKCEDLECLSQLIQTCGKNMDTPKAQSLMDQTFQIMEQYSHSPKYPARIRFMLRDVIELRKRNWVPRKPSNEGPMTMDQLQPDEDNLRSPYGNRNHRNQQQSHNDSEPHHWMNKMSMQSHSSEWNGLSVTNSSHYSQPYNSSPGNFNNRDFRDGVRSGGNMGGYRNNARDNNQHYNHHQNNNYNSQNQNRYNNINNKNMMHNNQQNNSHNNYNNLSNSMNMNKDLAPRFKRNLINAAPDPAEDSTFRPAANSLLFKKNGFANSTVLPLVQPRPNSSSNNSISSNHQNTNNHHLQANNTTHSDPPLPPVSTPIISVPSKLIAPQPVNNLLKKDQILIKQASLEKPKQTKKDKGPVKEEVLKKVQSHILENIVNAADENERNIDDIVASFIDLKVPDKFMRDALTTILDEIVDKSEAVHDRVFEFLVALRKVCKLQTNAIMEGFKAILNGKNENIIPRIATLVATLLCRAVTSKLCCLNDIANLAENGQHYPLFLLVLQQLHKTLNKSELVELYNASKVNLMTTLPEVDRTKDRMAEILEDRSLSFLYPLLKLQGELQKQIQSDPRPASLYKWIQQNVDATCFTDPGFITELMNVLLKYITQETTLAEGVDRKQNPSKEVAEQEKQLLHKYCPVLINHLEHHPDLQLVAIYVLQTFCYTNEFPKGMLLRWFKALYDLGVIEEEAFLRWKEDLSELYPGKGSALFQVNTYLTWLEEAESEEEEEDDE